MTPHEDIVPSSAEATYCACGCGKPTTWRSDRIKPNKYAFGHRPIRQHKNSDIPIGLCRCGCGQKTTIATASDRRCGWLKGQPTMYIFGHQMRKSPVDYIEEDRGYKTPCWIWQRAKDEDGYGKILVNGHNIMAHRYLYQKWKGIKVPPELEMDHLCRVRPCVNPDHLEPVTDEENIHRSRVSKLSSSQVIEMRAMRASGMTLQLIAEKYDISITNCFNICKGNSWRGVGGEITNRRKFRTKRGIDNNSGWFGEFTEKPLAP